MSPLWLLSTAPLGGRNGQGSWADADGFCRPEKIILSLVMPRHRNDLDAFLMRLGGTSKDTNGLGLRRESRQKPWPDHGGQYSANFMLAGLCRTHPPAHLPTAGLIV
jgi:hypothetical protein